MCHSNGLNQVDLLTSAERKISEKEYWAKRRGQKISMNTIQNWKRKDLLQDRQPFKRRSNTFVMRLIQLFYRQHPKKNFPDCCLRNIILHLKSVVADTATCILIVKIHYRKKSRNTLWRKSSSADILGELKQTAIRKVTSCWQNNYWFFRTVKIVYFWPNWRNHTLFPFYKIWFTHFQCLGSKHWCQKYSEIHRWLFKKYKWTDSLHRTVPCQ